MGVSAENNDIQGINNNGNNHITNDQNIDSFISVDNTGSTQIPGLDNVIKSDTVTISSTGEQVDLENLTPEQTEELLAAVDPEIREVIEKLNEITAQAEIGEDGNIIVTPEIQAALDEIDILLNNEAVTDTDFEKELLKACKDMLVGTTETPETSETSFAEAETTEASTSQGPPVGSSEQSSIELIPAGARVFIGSTTSAGVASQESKGPRYCPDNDLLSTITSYNYYSLNEIEDCLSVSETYTYTEIDPETGEEVTKEATIYHDFCPEAKPLVEETSALINEAKEILSTSYPSLAESDAAAQEAQAILDRAADNLKQIADMVNSATWPTATHATGTITVDYHEVKIKLMEAIGFGVYALGGRPAYSPGVNYLYDVKEQQENLQELKDSFSIPQLVKYTEIDPQTGKEVIKEKTVYHDFCPEGEALVDEAIGLLNDIQALYAMGYSNSAEAKATIEEAWAKLDEITNKLEGAMNLIDSAVWPIPCNTGVWYARVIYKGMVDAVKANIKTVINTAKTNLENTIKDLRQDYINACLFSKQLKLSEVYPDTFTGNLHSISNYIDYNLEKVRLEMMYGDIDKYKTNLDSGYQGLNENRMQIMFKALSTWVNVLRMMEMLVRSKSEAASLVHEEMTGIKGYEGMDTKGIVAKTCQNRMKQYQVFFKNLQNAIKAHNDRVLQEKIEKAKKKRKSGGWFKKFINELTGYAEKEYQRELMKIQRAFKAANDTMLKAVAAIIISMSVQKAKASGGKTDMIVMMENYEKQEIKNYTNEVCPEDSIADKVVDGLEAFLEEFGLDSGRIDNGFVSDAGDGYWDLDMDAITQYRDRVSGLQSIQKLAMACYFSAQDARGMMHNEMTGIGGVSSNKEVVMTSFSEQAQQRLQLMDRTTQLLVDKVKAHNEYNKAQKAYQRACISMVFNCIATILEVVAMVCAFIPALQIVAIVLFAVASILRSIGSLVADSIVSDNYEPKTMEAPDDTTDKILSIKEKDRDSNYEAMQACEYQQQQVLRDMALDESLLIDPGDGSMEVDSAKITEYRDRLVGIQNVMRMIRAVSKEKYSARSLVHQEMTGIGSAEASELIDDVIATDLLNTLTLFSAYTMELNEKANAHNIGWMREQRINKGWTSFGISLTCIPGANNLSTWLNEDDSVDIEINSSANFDKESTAEPGSADAALDQAESDAYVRLMNSGLGDAGDGYSAVNAEEMIQCIDELRKISNIKDAFARVKKAMLEARNLIHLEMTGVGGRRAGELTKQVQRADFENATQKFQLIVKFLQSKASVANRARDAEKAVERAKTQFWISWIPGYGALANTALDLYWADQDMKNDMGNLSKGSDDYLREAADDHGMSALDKAEREALLSMCEDVLADVGFGYMAVDSGYYAQARNALENIYRVKTMFADVSASGNNARAMMHRTMTGISGYHADGGLSVIEMNRTQSLSTLYVLKLRVDAIAERMNQMEDARKAFVAAAINLAIQICQSASGSSSSNEIFNIVKDMAIKAIQENTGPEKDADFKQSEFTTGAKGKGKGKGGISGASNFDTLEAQALADEVATGKSAFNSIALDKSIQSQREWIMMVWEMVQAIAKTMAKSKNKKSSQASGTKGIGKALKNLKEKFKKMLEKMKSPKKLLKGWLKKMQAKLEKMSSKEGMKEILQDFTERLKDLKLEDISFIGKDMDYIEALLRAAEEELPSNPNKEGGKDNAELMAEYQSITISEDMSAEALQKKMQLMVEHINNLMARTDLLEEDITEERVTNLQSAEKPEQIEKTDMPETARKTEGQAGAKGQPAPPAQPPAAAQTTVPAQPPAKGQPAPPAQTGAPGTERSDFSKALGAAFEGLKDEIIDMKEPFTFKRVFDGSAKKFMLNAPKNAYNAIVSSAKADGAKSIYKMPLKALKFLFNYNMRGTIFHRAAQIFTTKADDFGKQERLDFAKFHREAAEITETKAPGPKDPTFGDIVVDAGQKLFNTKQRANVSKLSNGQKALQESNKYIASAKSSFEKGEKCDQMVKDLLQAVTDNIANATDKSYNGKCKTISETVNKFMSDNKLMEKEAPSKDKWQNAEQTLKNGGDCEDIAILKAAMINAFLGGEAAVVVTEDGAHAEVMASESKASNTTVRLDIPHENTSSAQPVDNTEVVSSNISAAAATTDASITTDAAPEIYNPAIKSGEKEIMTRSLAVNAEPAETEISAAVSAALGNPAQASALAQSMITTATPAETAAIVQAADAASPTAVPMLTEAVVKAMASIPAQNAEVTENAIQTLATIKNTASSPQVVVETAQTVMRTMSATPAVKANVDKALSIEA
ncbi:MAG: hypothetical protein ABIH39_03705, partial [Candidatus Margulisiibacteriota bacterium]